VFHYLPHALQLGVVAFAIMEPVKYEPEEPTGAGLGFRGGSLIDVLLV
jgi:hypothetical protein